MGRFVAVAAAVVVTLGSAGLVLAWCLRQSETAGGRMAAIFVPATLVVMTFAVVGFARVIEQWRSRR